MQPVSGNLYLIDDDHSMRNSLSHMLRENGYMVQDFGSAHDFLNRSTPMSPAAILLDMQMPDMTGVELQERLITMERFTPIVFISGQSHPQQIVDGLKNGAIDFLLKPFGLKQLLESINRAIKLDDSLTQRLASGTQAINSFKSLTPREREVCDWLVKGLQSKDVAQKLGVAPRTVKIQKAKMMKKMGVSSVQELATLYVKNQLDQCSK
ncbi:response regulator transcription factor [Polynucleobacter sp. es-MAR-4]|uniref:response regulator transcription factor n=1 Tax=Polynucleobacter sp. es-MAR-4 TaxID=1855655 RepID=UPI001C0D14DB|nr:response regulator [Polynucleobacter sp. es-MAR-4]MBU3636068.1 response regulator transcription factor [Polynucleobacter sp. es-MAR-4]